MCVQLSFSAWQVNDFTQTPPWQLFDAHCEASVHDEPITLRSSSRA